MPIVRMFKPQFAPLVEAGTKKQTVRPTPKRMPRVGEEISLRAWLGAPYRSKQRVLFEAVVSNVEGITITDSGMIRIEPLTSALNYFSDRNEFARADGFSGWDEMRDWFRATHGLPFTGIVISWADCIAV